jgi:hypothetical protein
MYDGAPSLMPNDEIASESLYDNLCENNSCCIIDISELDPIYDYYLDDDPAYETILPMSLINDKIFADNHSEIESAIGSTSILHKENDENIIKDKDMDEEENEEDMFPSKLENVWDPPLSPSTFMIVILKLKTPIVYMILFQIMMMMLVRSMFWICYMIMLWMMVL